MITCSIPEVKVSIRLQIESYWLHPFYLIDFAFRVE
jgi:hypothetical protein